MYVMRIRNTIILVNLRGCCHDGAKCGRCCGGGENYWDGGAEGGELLQWWKLKWVATTKKRKKDA